LLGDLRGKATTAISAIKKSDPSFNLTTAVVTDLPALYPMVEASLHPYLEAAIRNHDITQKALTEMRAKSLDATWLGSLMTAHHEVLRDLLSITVPRIDQMIEAALNAGAFGAKIVGSGGGGSIVALSPPDRSNQLCEAIKKAGAIDAFEVSVAQGSKRIRS
ncbi:MAG: galactokinase, partial [Bacteroidota bacterium]